MGHWSITPILVAVAIATALLVLSKVLRTKKVQTESTIPTATDKVAVKRQNRRKKKSTETKKVVEEAEETTHLEETTVEPAAPTKELTAAERKRLQDVTTKLFMQYAEVKEQVRQTRREKQRKIFKTNAFAIDGMSDSEDEEEDNVLRKIKKLPLSDVPEALKKAIVDMQSKNAETLKELAPKGAVDEQSVSKGKPLMANDGEWQAVGAQSVQSGKKKRGPSPLQHPGREIKSTQKYNPDEFEFEPVNAPSSRGVVDSDGFVWDDERGSKNPASGGAGARRRAKNANKPPAQSIPGLVYI